MKKILILTLLSLAASLFGQSFVRDFHAEGIAAFYAGDFKKAKELLYDLEHKNDAKSRVADFILATIAASEADSLTATIRFRRTFENLPENHIDALLENFTKFADANRLYDFIIEMIKPFAEKHADIFERNHMAMYRYARALFEAGKKDEAAAVLKRVWELSMDNPAAEATDFLLFEDDLKALVVNDLKAGIAPLSIARMNALKGNFDAFALPENAGVGLAVWAFENQKASHDELEASLERFPNSLFAWNAWYILGAKFFEDGLYELAYGFSEKALTSAPDDIKLNWQIRMLKGDALRLLAKYDDAREAYKKIYMDTLAPGEAAAEAIYKSGLTYYDEKKWNASYLYFERVFLGYNAFDYWSSRAYYYGAKTRVEAGDNLGARNVLREYLKYSKHRDTQVFKNAEALYTNIKIK